MGGVNRLLASFLRVPRADEVTRAHGLRQGVVGITSEARGLKRKSVSKVPNCGDTPVVNVRPFEDLGLFAREAAAYLGGGPFSSSVIAVQDDGVLGASKTEGHQDGCAGPSSRPTRRCGDRHPFPSPFNLSLRPGCPTAARRRVGTVRLAGDPREDSQGVNGKLDAVAAFADGMNANSPAKGRGRGCVHRRVCRLGDCVLPGGVGGRPRPATARRRRTRGGLAQGLSRREAQPHSPMSNWRGVAEQRIRGRAIRNCGKTSSRPSRSGAPATLSAAYRR